MTLAAGLFLTGCAMENSGSAGSAGGAQSNSSGNSNSAGKRVVNVCSWGEYIDTDLIDQFEEQTGIKVNYQTAESNEALYSLLKNGGANYDVIVPSDYMISQLIEEDMLAELNYDNIPNFSLIDDRFKNLSYDPENKYTVPYTWGTLGIIYNSAMVEEEITSWGAVFDEKYAGDVLLIGNSRDALAMGLYYLGYSVNTTDEGEIREAYQLIADAASKGVYQGKVMDEIFQKMEGGNAAIGVYYAGDYLTMLENNEDLAFCVPEEGSNYFVDAMCIPKGAANKENAEKFINFMCSTEVGLANCDAIGYSTPLNSVLEALDAEVREDPVAYPSDDVLSRCEQFLNLPQDILEFYDSEWLRLKV